MTRTSQNQDILNHLQAGQKLTALGALNQFSCLRLAARIGNLIKQGHAIKKTMVIVGDHKKRVAEYYL